MARGTGRIRIGGGFRRTGRHVPTGWPDGPADQHTYCKAHGRKAGQTQRSTSNSCRSSPYSVISDDQASRMVESFRKVLRANPKRMGASKKAADDIMCHVSH